MEQNTRIIPGGAVLSGAIKAISSKSDLHRLIICGCLAEKSSAIRFEAKLSKDIEATISCLTALGAEISVKDSRIDIIKPIDRDNIPENPVLDCGESGSTARFLLPVAALLCKGATLIGSGKLPERPFEALCSSLSAMGAEFNSLHLPITVNRCAKPKDSFEISGNVSSQYITGLLFILPLCDAKEIKLTTPLESGGYVDLTADAMKKFAVTVTRCGDTYSVSGSYTAPAAVLDAQGDWSNAAFWLCAPGKAGKITVSGLDLTSSQPDRRVCEILSLMGMSVTFGQDSVTVSAENGTNGISFDARNIPDLVPILAVRAAISKGDTVISGIERLRIKESDRVSSVCGMINALGGEAVSDEHNIYIKGKDFLSGGTADSCNDHRIAMSAAIAASFCKDSVTIVGSKAVEKSYPQFYEHRLSLEKQG